MIWTDPSQRYTLLCVLLGCWGTDETNFSHCPAWDHRLVCKIPSGNKMRRDSNFQGLMILRVHCIKHRFYLQFICCCGACVECSQLQKLNDSWHLGLKLNNISCVFVCLLFFSFIWVAYGCVLVWLASQLAVVCPSNVTKHDSESDMYWSLNQFSRLMLSKQKQICICTNKEIIQQFLPWGLTNGRSAFKTLYGLHPLV